MADEGAKASPAGGAPRGPAKPSRPPNPLWRMMGLPNFRFKLPSRNWMIFLSITGSWTAAVMYDRREKRRIQRKWAKLVEPIAQEPLDEHQMPRKMTVYLSAPPADGLVPAREHFNEYVKPILVAAALDWDAIEGRREGDVRAGLAERIRRLRKKAGEPTTEPLEVDMAELLEETRARAGVREWDGPGGDIVIGRHTWKEYVRGLHEGWLGPLDSPAPAEEMAATPAAPVAEAAPDTSSLPSTPSTDEPKTPKEEENRPKKKKQPPPFIATTGYENASLPPNCPRAIGPSAAIPLPHLLGFLNFPIRIYRFLNRRQVADDIGRQTAAAVLGTYRPYYGPAESSSVMSADADYDSSQWEQQRLLRHEEPEWHKTVRERKDDDGRERVWLDDMVLDARIAERMRRFEIDADAEDRANRLARASEGTWSKSLWPKKEEKKKLWEGLSDDVE